jgi:hypothetical protein
MLRLHYVGRVPDHAVNIAYTESKGLTPADNVSLLDMSYKRAENLSSYVGGEFDVDLTNPNALVDTDEILLSSRSVLSPNVKSPVPLYYKYSIGRGVYAVEAPSSVGSNLELARLEIMKQLQILDRDNNKIAGPTWDIVVTARVGSTSWYMVTIYLEYRQAKGETFKVRYQGRVISTGVSLPNHIEVINAEPIMQKGVDFTLKTFPGGYQVSIPSASNYAPAIGIFYKGINISGSIWVYNPGGFFLPVDRIRLNKDDGSWVEIMLSGKTIAQLVHEINLLGIEYEASQLSDNPAAARLYRHNVLTVYKYGVTIRQDQYIRVRYDEETRVRCLIPHSDPDYLPWYPRIDFGEFSQDGTLSGAGCKFVFRPQGPETMPPGHLGGLTYDRMDEQPIYLGPQMLQLRRPWVISSSIVITRGEQVLNVLEDYDQLNSILFLSTPIGDISNVWVSYSYEEDSLIYTGVDLNPLGPHNPQLYGRYVGIYMTPAEILGPVPPCTYAPGLDGDIIPITFARTVYHVVGDTIKDIENAVANVKFDTGDSAMAILLGIYRVGQTAVIDSVQMTDTRSRGGGISEAVEPSKILGGREGEMFSDIGLFDGEPFPPTAVIVEYPSAVLGTGIAPMTGLPFADPSGFFLPSGLLGDVDVLNKMNRHKAGGVIVITSPEDSLNG